MYHRLDHHQDIRKVEGVKKQRIFIYIYNRFPLEADEGIKSLPLSTNIPVKIYRSTLSDKHTNSDSPFQGRESGTAPIYFRDYDDVYESGISSSLDRCPSGMSQASWVELRNADRELAQWEQSVKKKNTYDKKTNTQSKRPLTNRSTKESLNDCQEYSFSVLFI